MNNSTHASDSAASSAASAAVTPAQAWDAAKSYSGVDENLLEQLTEWRRHVHQNPELSYKEFQTTDYIASALEELGFEVRRFEFGSGLVCDIPAADDATSKDVVALRADIDALPMEETTGFDFASTNEGVCHSCGHDAHTAMLLGAATLLAKNPPNRPVRLIFQPAEETMPGGAVDCVKEGAVEGVDRIIALHCDPHRVVGDVGVHAGAITSSNAKLEVTLQASGGHTARPHETGDIVYALSTVATGVAQVVDRRIDPRSGTVLTWGSIQAGAGAPNVIPAKGTLVGTVRSASRDTWAELPELIPPAIRAIAEPYGVQVDVNYVQGVPPVVNDDACAEIATRAVTDVLGEQGVGEALQSSGGEDFGWYTEEIPGIYLRLGVWDGEGPETDLHHPAFAMDERALVIGATVFDRFARLDR
ncbi:amidohydrolase [Corynebacterium suicordis]|uniref:amidohydrolase n=1 Tax=uncultured Corynebacterium sp. TaxID=159447 RepID=UPI00259682DA|nr:amidohydrolase [uncultured Corynebacterium sp.]